MANVFDRYGIKEVADVTFYSLDENEQRGVPVLYLDTLKVSTIEQTAENAEARGGKGNAALISWDFGKEITVTLEDALYSPKSLALIYGDDNAVPEELTAENHGVIKTLWSATSTFSNVNGAAKTVTTKINGQDITLTDCKFYLENGTEPQVAPTKASEFNYVTGKMPVQNALKIDITANSFPGTYYITGDTFARNEANGKDEFFQFIIPKAKVMSESNTITMEAEGDPTVFSMNLKVLRPRDGVMMKLVQYNVN